MSYQAAHGRRMSRNSNDSLPSVYELSAGDVTQLTTWMDSRDGRTNDMNSLTFFAWLLTTVISTYVRRLLTVDICLMKPWHKH